jgi:hypothetical protein
MPLMRADGLIHIDQDWNIVFPMKDKRSRDPVSCQISTRSVRDLYGAALGDEFTVFGRYRAAIEASASADYDAHGGPPRRRRDRVRRF